MLLRHLLSVAERGIDLHAAVLPPAAAADAHGEHGHQLDPTLQYDLPVTQMTRLLAELGVAATDLTPALARLGSRRAFLGFDGHLSPASHAAVADAMQATFPSLRACSSQKKTEPRSPMPRSRLDPAEAGSHLTSLSSSRTPAVGCPRTQAA